MRTTVLGTSPLSLLLFIIIVAVVSSFLLPVRGDAHLPRYTIVVITPPHAPRYARVFTEVSEVLHDALCVLGRNVTTEFVPSSSTPPPRDRRWIVLGANMVPLLESFTIPSDAILFNLEQLEGNDVWVTDALRRLFRQHVVWDYHPRNIETLRAMGVERTALVPIGYAPVLTKIVATNEDIDVVFVGSLNSRREAVLDALRARGVRVVVMTGRFGRRRDVVLARARVVLNIHYYEAKLLEVVRLIFLLANHRFVISEASSDPFHDDLEWAPGVVFAPYEELAATVLRYLGLPHERKRVAQAGFEMVKKRDMATILAPVLHQEEQMQQVL